MALIAPSQLDVARLASFNTSQNNDKSPFAEQIAPLLKVWEDIGAELGSASESVAREWRGLGQQIRSCQTESKLSFLCLSLMNLAKGAEGEEEFKPLANAALTWVRENGDPADRERAAAALRMLTGDTIGFAEGAKYVVHNFAKNPVRAELLIGMGAGLAAKSVGRFVGANLATHFGLGSVGKVATLVGLGTGAELTAFTSAQMGYQAATGHEVKLSDFGSHFVSGAALLLPMHGFGAAAKFVKGAGVASASLRAGIHFTGATAGTYSSAFVNGQSLSLAQTMLGATQLMVEGKVHGGVLGLSHSFARFNRSMEGATQQALRSSFHNLKIYLGSGPRNAAAIGFGPQAALAGVGAGPVTGGRSEMSAPVLMVSHSNATGGSKVSESKLPMRYEPKPIPAGRARGFKWGHRFPRTFGMINYGFFHGRRIPYLYRWARRMMYEGFLKSDPRLRELYDSGATGGEIFFRGPKWEPRIFPKDPNTLGSPTDSDVIYMVRNEAGRVIEAKGVEYNATRFHIGLDGDRMALPQKVRTMMDQQVDSLRDGIVIDLNLQPQYYHEFLNIIEGAELTHLVRNSGGLRTVNADYVASGQSGVKRPVMATNERVHYWFKTPDGQRFVLTAVAAVGVAGIDTAVMGFTQKMGTFKYGVKLLAAIGSDLMGMAGLPGGQNVRQHGPEIWEAQGNELVRLHKGQGLGRPNEATGEWIGKNKDRVRITGRGTNPFKFRLGEPLGHFALGSTVILSLPESMNFKPHSDRRPGEFIKAGTPLGTINRASSTPTPSPQTPPAASPTTGEPSASGSSSPSGAVSSSGAEAKTSRGSSSKPDPSTWGPWGAGVFHGNPPTFFLHAPPGGLSLKKD